MTASRIFLYFCLSFIFGIFLSSFFEIFLPVLLAVLILGIILISVFWKYKKLVIAGFCLLFLAAGACRLQAAKEDLKYARDLINNFTQKVSLTGVIISEPDIREGSQRLTLKIIPDNNPPIFKGKILVALGRYPEYQYGGKIKITGKLEIPQEFPDFDYKNYLAKDGIYAVMNFPEVELLEKRQGGGFISAVYATILNFKNKLREGINQNLSPPQSSILAAIILGDKRTISSELREKLSVSGLSHITSVSGLHVAVLTSILGTFLLSLGFWRQQAFYLTLILITFFIAMSGFQPSAVRAGIMGGIFLFAQYLGKIPNSSRAIVFALSLMLWQNPLLLRYDVGFQLSFLAMFGLIYVSGSFKDWLRFIPGTTLGSTLAMTFSAYFFTLPLLIYNFGYVSLVAPFTNLLVVPIIYWLMLSGFIFAFFGMVWQALAWVLSLPTWLLLAYLIKVVDFFSQPWAFRAFRISWIWLLISYLFLGFIARRLQDRQRLKFLRY